MARIQLLINHNRKEILRDGWGTVKTAKAFLPAVLQGSAHIESALPANATFDPDSGMLRLKPNFQKDDFYWNADYSSHFLQMSDFVFGDATEWEETPGQDEDGQETTWKFVHTVRDLSTPGALTSIGSLTADLAALVTATDDTMVPAMRTRNPLGQDEGFGFVTWNFGYSTDRDEFYRWGVFFGGRWFLTMHVSGKWTLWRNWGDQETPSWKIAQEWHVAQWACQTGDTINVAVVPMQPNRLAFYISNASEPVDRTRKFAGSQGAAFIHEVELAPGEDILTYVSNLWVFVQAGQVSGGELLNGTHYSIAIHKVRYAAETVRLMPEWLPRPLPGVTPSITAFSYKGPPAGTPYGSVTPTYLNDDGSAWTAATDRAIVPVLAITPDAGGVHTPEVAGYELRFATTTYTPAATPIDLTGEWFSLSFTLSAEPAGSTLSAMLRRYDGYADAFKRDASVRLLIDSVPVWDGYIEKVTNTIHGAKGPDGHIQTGTDPETEEPIFDDVPLHAPYMLTSLEGYDMWERLDRCRFARYVPVHFLSKPYMLSHYPTLYDSYKDVFERAGMDTLSADADVDGIVVDEWRGIDSMPAPQEDASAGDCVRDLHGLYGIQNRRPIRAAWSHADEAWDPAFGPVYADDPQDPTEGELPTIFICLEGDIPDVIEGSAQTDANRFDVLADRQYLIANRPLEITVASADYNALSAFGSTSGDQRARGISAHVDPDPNSLSDPDHIDYQAGVRTLTLPMSETGSAPDILALSRLARHRYDRDCTTERHASIGAEWQPFASPLAPRPFVAVIGRNPDGDLVSYGAFRIVQVDVQLDTDNADGAVMGFGGDAPDRTHFWEGDYLLEYVGIADYVIGDVSIPMFTENLPVMA